MANLYKSIIRIVDNNFIEVVVLPPTCQFKTIISMGVNKPSFEIGADSCEVDEW